MQSIHGLLMPVDRQDLITLRELTMLQIMNQITDKPNWEDKVGVVTAIPLLKLLQSLTGL